MFFYRIFIVFFFLFFSGYGRESFSSGFYNLKYEETKVRFGPGEQNPIKFFLKYPKLPVEIIKSYKDWYFIHDFEGEGGWVHKRMVFQGGIVLVTAQADLKKEKKMSSPTLARLSKGVLVKLKDCQNKLCRVEIKNNEKTIVGWVAEKNLWGVNH